MAEQWEFYFADIGGNPGSIGYDAALYSEFKNLDAKTAIAVFVPLRESRADGLTTDAEFERLTALEDSFLDAMADVGVRYAGRQTYSRKRVMIYYVRNSDSPLIESLETIANSHNYTVDIDVRPDPDGSLYYNDLYLNPESQQVMRDMDILDALRSYGDDMGTPRPIEHHTIFTSAITAEEFATWVETEGFTVDRVYAEGLFSNRRHYVDTHKLAAPTLGPITQQTLAHFRKANELGGIYDGWGCEVRKAKD